MKRSILLIIWLCIFESNYLLKAQHTYSFSKRIETYTELDNPTQLNTDPWSFFDRFTMNTEFYFSFFDSTFNLLYMHAGFSTFTFNGSQQGIDDYSGYEIYVFDADIEDRGFYISPYNVTQSPISYKSVGNSGNRIFKLQWKNAGFIDDETSEDYVNFQLWLYEKDYKIEMHYGPSSIKNPEVWSFESGPTVGILNEDGSEGIILTGDPSYPTAQINSYPNIFLTGAPPENMVYVFSRSGSGISDQVFSEKFYSLYPIPCNEVINLKIECDIMEDFYLEMMNSYGQVIFKQVFNSDSEIIDISDYPKGVYFIRVKSGKYINTEKIMKY